MANSECERQGCQNPATHQVTFTQPYETVDYCEACVTTIRREFDYEGVVKI